MHALVVRATTPPVVYPPTPEQARNRNPLLCIVRAGTHIRWGWVGLDCYTVTLAHGISFFFGRLLLCGSLFDFSFFFFVVVGTFEMPTGSHRFQTELAPTCEAAAAGRARKHGVVDPSFVTVSRFTQPVGSNNRLCASRKDKNGYDSPVESPKSRFFCSPSPSRL